MALSVQGMDDRVVSIRPGVEPAHDIEQIMRETAIDAISTAAAGMTLIGMAITIIGEHGGSTISLYTPDGPVSNGMIAGMASALLAKRAAAGYDI